MSRQIVVLGLVAIIAAALALQVSVGLALTVLALCVLGMLRIYLRQNSSEAPTKLIAQSSLSIAQVGASAPEAIELLPMPDGKRPFWVWAICVFYAIGVLETIVILFFYWNGNPTVTAIVDPYVARMTLLGISITLLGTGVKLVAVLLLFTLRRQCIPLFGLLLVLRILLGVWAVANKTSDLGRSLLAVVISLAVFLYTRELRESGVLK